MRAMLCAAAALPASHAAVRILESEGSGAQQTLPLRLEEGSSESALSADLKKGLQKQWLRGLDEHGESITIMAVGEAGVGKTTLFSNLFLRDLSSPPGPTHTILEQTVHFGALRTAQTHAKLRSGLGRRYGCKLELSVHDTNVLTLVFPLRGFRTNSPLSFRFAHRSGWHPFQRQVS